VSKVTVTASRFWYLLDVLFSVKALRESTFQNMVTATVRMVCHFFFASSPGCIYQANIKNWSLLSGKTPLLDLDKV
jgi:hypothetical protein